MTTPLVIFDGNCGFCRIWINYWKQLTDDRVAYAPSQEVAAQFPQVAPEAFSKAVHFVDADGTISSGARAVMASLDKLWLYRPFAGLLEWGYRLVADHRDFFYQVTRFTFGRRVEVDRFATTQTIFLKLLALVYASAFASLAVQITGLIGTRGILPADQFFAGVRGAYGTAAYFAVPSLFWLGVSDAWLRGGCWLGVALAALVVLGRFERAALALLYALYLSYSLAGQVFMGFQWDALLLEAGFLAIFFGRSRRQQRIVAWLYRLLVFRLYFLSGWVKLASGDRSWRDWSALGYHFHTQPLPTVFAWYADQMPAWLLHASTGVVLIAELGIPFLIFAPRCWRLAGAWLLLVVQAGIFLTGNYTFFNLLTMALTLFLFDDRALERLPRIRRREAASDSSQRWRMAGGWLAILLAALGLARLLETTRGTLPQPVTLIADSLWQFQIVNSYGLFAVMTKTRPEIVVEGSLDGEHWLAYEFRYKPGDFNRAPRWAAPHQPRLDWQMWFAALDDQRASPWFAAFVEKLLQGSPEVLGLLASDPFGGRAPRYVRATLYDYRFTRFGEAGWWKRSLLGPFFPAVSLKPDGN